MGASCSRNNLTLSEHVRDRVFGRNSRHSLDDLEECALRAAQQLLNNGGKQRFEALYCNIETVSYGASSTVVRANERASGKVVACKVIPKLKSSCQRVVHRKLRTKVIYEIAAMLTVSEHRNAAKLHAAHEDDKNYYLIMDYYSGGELFDHIVRRREGFTEDQAAAIMKDLLDFLMYSHGLGLIHADIKPENIVYSKEGESGVLKIIDFGLSVFCSSNETHKNVFGTIGYCSPEMANDVTGQKTDIWSAGILLYFMLSGKPPFRYANKEVTLCRLKKKPLVAFSEEIWDNVSNEAISFIRSLLDPCPNRRVSASEALKLSWLQDSLVQVRSANKLGTIACDSLRLFGNLSRLKRLFWECVARTAPYNLVGDQLEQFRCMDLDGNGLVDFDEFVSALRKARPDLTDHELGRVFAALDVDQSGDIDRTEFVAASIALLAPEHQEEFTLSSFQKLDTEGSGFVSREELRDAILAQMDDKIARNDNVIADLDSEIETMDINGDGVISFEEFNCAITENMSVDTLPPFPQDLDELS